MTNQARNVVYSASMILTGTILHRPYIMVCLLYSTEDRRAVVSPSVIRKDQKEKWIPAREWDL